jgi:hypothetical protein
MRGGDGGRRSAVRRPGEEDGSAYIIALLVLLILTLLGLHLSLVTQTEILIGANDRIVEKTFYAAESGLDLSVARALADGDFDAVFHERVRSEIDTGQRVEIRERVSSSPFFCVGDAPCNLCSINQGRNYARRNHVLSVNAVRDGITPSGPDVELAAKSLTSMVDVEPMERQLGCLADLPTASSGFKFDTY